MKYSLSRSKTFGKSTTSAYHTDVLLASRIVPKQNCAKAADTNADHNSQAACTDVIFIL